MAATDGADAVADQLHQMVGRTTSLPCVLVDADEGRISEVSAAGAKLLGGRRADLRGTPVAKVAPLAWTSDPMRLLLGGGVEVYAASSTVRRTEGRLVRVKLWARMIESATKRWVVLSFVPESDANGPSLMQASDLGPTVIGFGDGDGNIGMISEDVRELLGHDPEHLRRHPSGFVHADDLPEYLLTISTVVATGRARHVRARVRHADGHWVPVQVIVASLPHAGEHRVGFVLRADTPGADAERIEQLTDLEDRLRRIAVELAAVGVSDHVSPEVARRLADLSPRQREVLRLLQEGARVPTIAQNLFLSQSTVRNHLSAIFRRFGVSSQEALLRELRR